MAVFSSSGHFLDGDNGPVAVAPPMVPREGESLAEARERVGAMMEQLASALNAAQALIEKIDDNPALFFGMEDTCQDEFDDLREALEKLA